ncbi:MAG: AraC family transcriptional regulator [Flavobacteriales bacterium]|nr:AraC family transcriptional regulator [Flavobacteriales bacterium]
MTYLEQPAPEPLRDYVRCIRVIEAAPTEERRPAPVLPCGCPELLIRASSPDMDATTRTTEHQARCILQGQMSRAPAPGSSPGLAGGAATFRFLPDGASALFGLRMDAMTDRRASLAEICGRSGRQFEERSIDWRTMEERIDAGTEFLLARKPRCAPDPLVRDLVQRIEECRGQVALAQLKRSFAISARQVERRFTLAVGLTPKLFARIMRLSWFAEHAERCADRTLAEIAREVGYFDQAHLNHDFKALTGVSPKQYFGMQG